MSNFEIQGEARPQWWSLKIWASVWRRVTRPVFVSLGLISVSMVAGFSLEPTVSIL